MKIERGVATISMGSPWMLRQKGRRLTITTRTDGFRKLQMKKMRTMKRLIRRVTTIWMSRSLLVRQKGRRPTITTQTMPCWLSSTGRLSPNKRNAPEKGVEEEGADIVLGIRIRALVAAVITESLGAIAAALQRHGATATKTTWFPSTGCCMVN